MKIEKVLPDGRVHCKDCSERAGHPVYLPREQFYRNKRSRIGLQQQCKSCYSIRQKQYRNSCLNRLETDLHKLRQETIFRLWPCVSRANDGEQ